MPRLIDITTIESAHKEYIMVPDYNDARLHEQRSDRARCEREAEHEDSAIEEMLANTVHVDDLLAYTGTDVSVLLSMLLTRGLPAYGRLDVTEKDDEYYDMSEGQLDRLRSEFEFYARSPIHRESPLATFMRRRQEDSL